jgi:quercetin dioxygenase-like cupin family protein
MAEPETSPRSALILGAGEGTAFTARGSELVFKAMAETTGGGFSLMERVLPPGGRPPPRHVHPDCTEAFYLLEGTLDFSLDQDWVSVAGGGFVLVPGGVAHSFVNASGAPARVLILHSPALDGYFRDLHELWLGPPPSVEQEQELMRKHGLRPVAE